jgi:ribokinase
MILIFGSLNMDIAIQVENFPEPGETILSKGYVHSPGGKGGNQALAAARASNNTKVALIGRVGNDDYGRILREELKSNGVMVSGVTYTDNVDTGLAIVTRDHTGENNIIVMSGANKEATHEQVPDEVLQKGNVLLMQMELPVDQTAILLERAHARGVKTILNLAPAITLPKKAFGNLDYLIVNSIEARQIAAKLNLKTENNAVKLAQALAIEGQLTCIVTIGKGGSVAVTKDGQAWGVPIMPLDQSLVVDITGAGDAYCGTLAAAIHDGIELPEAMRRASVAGSLTCLKAGTQTAMPFVDDINKAMVDMPKAEAIKL